MSLFDYFIICAAAFLAGAVNSIAGGGTLLTFPALIYSLKPPAGHESIAYKIANCTSTIALMPGSLASAWAYRFELERYRPWLARLFWPSLVGGAIGSLLLFLGKDETFGKLVPWLVLAATLLFAFQPKIAKWLRIGQPTTYDSLATSEVALAGSPSSSIQRNNFFGIMLFQFIVSVYGGYFGAGIGILMLSALAMMGLTEIHGMNAVKTILAALINAVAVLIFLYKQYFSENPEHILDWRRGIPMLFAGIAGGYTGARVATKMNKVLIRYIIIAIGFWLVAWFFYKQYFSN